MNLTVVGGELLPGLDEASLQELIDALTPRLELPGVSVSVAFVPDSRMQELNSRYRGLDSTTDVLSFAGTGDELGDIVIATGVLVRQAGEFGVPVSEELRRLVVHALLHLSGMDHNDDDPEDPMLALQERILADTVGAVRISDE